MYIILVVRRIEIAVSSTNSIHTLCIYVYVHGTGALYSARFVIANVLTCAPSVAAITISKLINA